MTPKIFIRENKTSQIIKKLPSDFSKHAVRDISILTCSIIGDVHVHAIKDKFGAKFTMTLWAEKGNQVVFYRSAGEYQNFSKIVGEKFRKSLTYTKKIANKLIEFTDWFNLFLKKNEKIEDLIKNNKIFFKNYKDFFACHQAVNWGSDYLHKLIVNGKEKKEISERTNILDSAYKYNELVVPELDKYFKKLNIDYLLYDEVNKDVYKNIESMPKNRSLMFIGNKRIILTNEQAVQIEKTIKNNSEKSFEGTTEVKGIIAQKGKYEGIVKRIIDLDKLKECKNGDVLVTSMTRPQFNEFIKQVGAIVTDEGGMLCHASILAREFDIPCLVATKIATKVLRDGDLVEVDANKGIVKILKKN